MRHLNSKVQSRVARMLPWAVVALAGCIDPFNPELKDADNRLLVVDGYINARGISTIKLSRSFDVKATGQPPVEARARVYIEDEAGSRITLNEAASAPGTYTSPAQTLAAGRKYRLHLFSAAGREYASDYTAVTITPEIDSLGFQVADDGVEINVSTHDANNQAQYYRWDFDETWEFTSAHRSLFEWKNNQIQFRQEDIYRCWTSAPSTTIRLTNTTQLGQAVVSRLPLTTLPKRSAKLQVKYSILVKQHAQTAEEYAYWDLLRKNTENIGTLFDPLPSQLTGNVHDLNDPDQPVLGYVGAYSTTEKRLFIDRSELPRPWLSFDTGYESCQLTRDVYLRDVRGAFSSFVWLPIEGIYSAEGTLLGYTASTPECVDCRKRGTNVRPSFWR
ncbi:DUF4249 domain-containing protein [Hymenobacter sp. CRA2]|uniref:DUF4249 domain-containing protein n=1 Tax=Hymenobacter sp. CRA2 TaxID=1955620 RepID=UPI00098EA24B|nr:DUF4249 domain-containing protein [Hymenobacter sp. CRA2]OON69607.1 hypothetical protein B0919_06620 [Hymenobacter sp. CRA2]